MTQRKSHSDCPFCRLLSGQESELNNSADIVFRDQNTCAFISPKWWKSNPAHIIVVPSDHFTNIYDIPEDVLGRVYATAKKVSQAIRDCYACDGTSMRQHNEAGGGQDVWHFHVHVFPRFHGDRLYERNGQTRFASSEERAPYAKMLREHLRL